MTPRHKAQCHTASPLGNEKGHRLRDTFAFKQLLGAQLLPVSLESRKTGTKLHVAEKERLWGGNSENFDSHFESVDQ